MEKMVVTALQSPSFYAQTYNNKGDTMSGDSESPLDIEIKRVLNYTRCWGLYL